MCECENILFFGTSIPGMLKPGWIYAIKRDQKFGHFSIVINHNGDQEEIPISFCPHCGRELTVTKSESTT